MALMGVTMTEVLSALQGQDATAYSGYFLSDGMRVGTALSDFFVNLVESVLVVILILVVFMGLRSSLIIGLCLLITVIGSFVILSAPSGTHRHRPADGHAASGRHTHRHHRTECGNSAAGAADLYS